MDQLKVLWFYTDIQAGIRKMWHNMRHQKTWININIVFNMLFSIRSEQILHTRPLKRNGLLWCETPRSFQKTLLGTIGRNSDENRDPIVSSKDEQSRFSMENSYAQQNLVPCIIAYWVAQIQSLHAYGTNSMSFIMKFDIRTSFVIYKSQSLQIEQRAVRQKPINPYSFHLLSSLSFQKWLWISRQLVWKWI